MAATNGHSNGSHSNGTLYLSPAAKLRQMLAEPGKVVVAPGVYDGLSARIALSVGGHDALYMTGAGVTASRLGLPDLAFASQDDFVSTAAMLTSLDPTCPVICDADVGFGGPNQVARTLTRYNQVGVASLHIEDQVMVKRCGHLGGKELVSREEFLVRIRAAALARDAIPGGSDIVLIARTDSLQSYGLDEAIERLKAAAAVGADMAFCEGVKSKEDLQRLVTDLAPMPVKASILFGGSAPDMTVEEMRQIGVKMITYPGIGLKGAMDGMINAYTTIARDGTDKALGPLKPKDLFKLVGLDKCMAFDQAAGANTYKTLM